MSEVKVKNMANPSQTHPIAAGLAFELEPPSLAALEVSFQTRPLLFNYSHDYDPEDPFATNTMSEPRIGQPLGSLFMSLGEIKRERDMVAPNVLPGEDIKIGRASIEIQLNLTKAIHRIYLNLLYQRGASPFDIPQMLAEHLDKADQERHDSYKDKEEYYLAFLECLEAGYLPDNLGYFMKRAPYTDGRKTTDPPASEEVMIEGAKEGAERELERTRNFLHRLDFESMSALAILQAMRDGMSPEAIAGTSLS